MITVKQIEAAKPKSSGYRIADSGGLFLFVTPAGKKVWRLRYRFDGREKTLVIGEYPHISLADARAKASEAKVMINAGGDPAAEKRKSKIREIHSDQFDFIFREWINHKRQVWSPRYATETERMFGDDILPLIGHLRMEEIEPMSVLSVIRKFEHRGAMERANKARRRIGEVFSYAISTGRAKYNPAPDLSGAMKGYRKQNFAFLTADQIPGFNKALKSFSGSIVSRTATQVLQLTAVRTKELRSMKWRNVDFVNMMITIDAEEMKSRKIHLVPMSSQVADLLRLLKPVTEVSEYVFAGRNDPSKPISDNTILGVIRWIGYQGMATGHGFRHQFSTILNENGWPADVIEKQLAHATSGTIRGIYNHAQYLDKRREMMQWWADWLDRHQN
ncbi:tyrosine-type recombinase/integrase [Lonsdalea quercina]|uniref:tyrosine-type recombinase/integrase n=1 Tax=Lonsdalea quercina TaxID=71657 RepID=UPI0039748FD4